jgi:Ca-activated chloride channel homolog
MRRHNNFRLRLALALSAVLALGAGFATAQFPQLPPPPAPPVTEGKPNFTTETREVTLHVSVLDRNDRLITDIPRSAFHVYENDVEQAIKVFKREDVPVSMCILIDSSGSMRDKHSSVVAAALALVKASNPEDEICFVNFNDEAYLDQPFTNSLQKLEEAMSKIDSRGGTAMRNAISGAVDYVKQEAKREKRVLVVVTDGNDNASEMKLEELVRKVRDSEVLVYLIGLLNQEERGEARRAKRAMEDLAEASGGLDYYPDNISEVQKITPQIANEIRNQYTLAYTPTNTELDGSYRRVRVEVKGIGRHTVRTRPGYYAKLKQTAGIQSQADRAE